MIQRAIAIMEALAGGAVDQAIMLRVAKSFVPHGVDAEAATNLEIATYFVREMRRYVRDHARNVEAAAAGDLAADNARAAFSSEVNLGDD